MLWGLVLTEAKVVLQARQPHLLTMAAETLSALLFPFSWQHVYIPILPARLLDILRAPVPFLIGVDDQVLGMAEKMAGGGIPDEVVQVDLDKNEVLCGEAQAQAVVLPQKPYAKLYKALLPYCRAPNTEEGTSGNAASAFRMAPPPDVEVALPLTLALPLALPLALTPSPTLTPSPSPTPTPSSILPRWPSTRGAACPWPR